MPKVEKWIVWWSWSRKNSNNYGVDSNIAAHGVSLFLQVWEKNKEKQLCHEMIESGVIKDGKGSKAA